MNNFKAKHNGASAKHVSTIKSSENDYFFEVYDNGDYLTFGSFTGVLFFEAGNMLTESGFSLDENIQALVCNIDSYYEDGAGFQDRDFSCRDSI